MKQTKNLVIAGLCIALALVLPMAFHAIPNAGSIFLPMHIPVLLCGLACGVLSPLLSSLATGMPPAAMLPSMLCELAMYGLMSGLLFRLVKTKSFLANTYVSLIGAMICGRVFYGVLNAVIFKAGAYSMQLWMSAAFITAVPGIVIQLVVIPLILVALKKARLVALPARA